MEDISGYISKLREAAGKLESLLEIRSEDDLRNALTYLIEAYSGNSDAMKTRGLRNEAVKIVVDQLNQLTYDRVFQDDYKVSYEKVDRKYTTTSVSVCDQGHYGFTSCNNCNTTLRKGDVKCRECGCTFN